MFIVILVPPLQVENPMKVHIHQQRLKLFQTPLSRSSSFYLKITMSVPCPFVFKKKRVVWKLSNLSSLPAHLPKTSHFDFVKACRQVDEPNGSQRKSHLISAGSAYCCRWYLVFFSNLTIHGSHDIKFP